MFLFLCEASNTLSAVLDATRCLSAVLLSTCHASHCSPLFCRSLRQAMGADCGDIGLSLTLSTASLLAPVRVDILTDTNSATGTATVTDADVHHSAVQQLHRCTALDLRTQELPSHLLSLLAALLLQDASRERGSTATNDLLSSDRHTGQQVKERHSRGQKKKMSKSPPPPPAVPLMLVCRGVLQALNSYSSFDLRAAQDLPDDLKVC